MQFYEPGYLKLLLGLPLLVLLGALSAKLWRFKVRRLGYEPLVIKKLMPGFRSSEGGIRIFYLCLVFTFLILALARPQWGERTKQVERKGVDVIFLLDTSLSMLAEDVRPSRFEKAKQTIKSMVRQLKGDRVGLVVFSGSAYLQTPLTLDYAAFMLFLESVKVGHVPDPGSSLSSALNFILKIFPKEDLKYKVLVLMTEGEDNLGGIEDAIKALNDAHIRVYSIGMGTSEGGPIPLKDKAGRQVGFKKDKSGAVVITRMDPEVLQKISSETQGLFLPATAAGREVDLILKHMSTLGQKNLNEKMITEKEDHYEFFIILAFIFLLLELFVKKSRKIPQALMIFISLILFSGFIQTPRGLNNKANEAYGEKKYQTAIEDYRKAKVKDPDDAVIRYNLGSALYQTQQYQDARNEFKKAVELSKDDPALQAKSFYNLGNSEYRLGNFEGAINSYKEALKLDPNDKEAKHNLEFVQNQKSLFDKKNDERKKENPQQNQQQNQQNQNQQNQSQQSQQSQQNQDQQSDQQNQNQDQQQNQQNQSSQSQEQGGQGGGSGQQDPNTQENGAQDSSDPKSQEPSQGGAGQQDQQDESDQEKNQSHDQQEQKDQEQREQKQNDQEQSAGQKKTTQTKQDQDKQSEGQNQDQSKDQGDQEKQGEDQKPQPEPQDTEGENPANRPEPSNEDAGEDQNESEDFEPTPLSEGDNLEDQNAGDEEESAGKSSEQQGQDDGQTGGSGSKYQGQMSMESALKILGALHEGEKEFSDLRRPVSRRPNHSVEKDW